MDNETKTKINERYQQELRRGEFFWPDSIFKDLIVSLAIFILLVLLATFIGVAPEPKADPSDTSYLPRPEWYFLFLFQMLRLKIFAGELGQFLGAVAIPGAFMALLAALPFIDRSPERNIFKRPIALIGWIVVMAIILIFTVSAIINREFLD